MAKTDCVPATLATHPPRLREDEADESQFLSSNRYNVIKAELNVGYYHFPPITGTGREVMGKDWHLRAK